MAKTLDCHRFFKGSYFQFREFKTNTERFMINNYGGDRQKYLALRIILSCDTKVTLILWTGLNKKTRGPSTLFKSSEFSDIVISQHGGCESTIELRVLVSARKPQ